MRLTLVIVFLVNCVLSCSAMQTSRVPAKAEGCVDEVCGTLCEYDGHKFFPGESQTLYRHFTCLEMTCSNDFHVQFEPCPFDYSGRCHFENYDNSTMFPDCCGVKVCM